VILLDADAADARCPANIKSLAVDEAGVFGEEEGGGLGDVFRGADAAGWDGCERGDGAWVVGRVGDFVEFGGDRPGADAVDGDAVRGQFERPGARQANQRRLSALPSAERLEMLTMRPMPRCRMAGASAWVH